MTIKESNKTFCMVHVHRSSYVVLFINYNLTGLMGDERSYVILGFTDHGRRNWSKDSLHDRQMFQVVMSLSTCTHTADLVSPQLVTDHATVT